MPFHVQAIGPFTFDSLRGEFQFEREELELIVRPGVNGTGVRRLGVRGRPFTVETWRYETSYLTAELVFTGYLGLISGDPVQVTKNGVVFIDQHQVLDVEKTAIVPAATVVGSIVPAPGVLLIARWSLLAMPVTTFVPQT